jgi:hypothetical protein
MEPVTPGSPGSRISSVDCYPSFSEAIYAATDGAVSLPPDASLKAQLQALRRQLEPMETKSLGSGSVLLGTDYVDSIYRGNTLSYVGSATCSSTVSYQFPAIPDPYNDQISSTQAYGGCNHNILYENSYYGGATLTCYPSCVGLGVMNDAASSRQFQSSCGESTCVSPDGAYISHFTGSNCDGTESYYLPYDSYGYQCRPDSSTGALCGTVHNTVTNRSYRYNGQCYPNAWPSGNTLSDFVTVYR